MKTKIKLQDGKYEIVEDLSNGVFKCLRYGNEWRNLIGDKLVFSLFYKIQEKKEEIKKLKGDD